MIPNSQYACLRECSRLRGECPQKRMSPRNRTLLRNGEESILNRPRCLWSGTLGMATTTQGTCCGSCSHYPGRSHRSRSHIVSCSHLPVFYRPSRRGEFLIPTPVPTLLDIICTRNEHCTSSQTLACNNALRGYLFAPSVPREEP